MPVERRQPARQRDRKRFGGKPVIAAGPRLGAQVGGNGGGAFGVEIILLDRSGRPLDDDARRRRALRRRAGGQPGGQDKRKASAWNPRPVGQGSTVLCR
jgi:hypothetical protein